MGTLAKPNSLTSFSKRGMFFPAQGVRATPRRLVCKSSYMFSCFVARRVPARRFVHQRQAYFGDRPRTSLQPTLPLRLDWELGWLHCRKTLGRTVGGSSGHESRPWRRRIMRWKVSVFLTDKGSYSEDLMVMEVVAVTISVLVARMGTAGNPRREFFWPTITHSFGRVSEP